LASELKWVEQSSSPTAILASDAAAAAPSGGMALPSGASDAAARPAPHLLPHGRRIERIAWGLVTLALLATVATLAARAYLRPAESPRVVSASILPPLGASFDRRFPPALSPDGKMIAASVLGADGKTSLYLRELGKTEMRMIPGTEGAGHPFWSPDGHGIAFF